MSGRRRVPPLPMPLFIENEAQNCLLACALAVVAYWRVERPDLDWGSGIPKDPAASGWRGYWMELFDRLKRPGMTFEYSLKSLQSEIDRLRQEEGIPLRLREVEEQVRGRAELLRLISNKIPPIVILDDGLYFRGASEAYGHSVVVRGYQPGNVITLDPSMRESFPYEEERFEEAWEARSFEMALVVPTGTRLGEQKIQAPLEKWV